METNGARQKPLAATAGLWRWCWVFFAFAMPFLVFGAIAAFGQYGDCPAYTFDERCKLALSDFLYSGTYSGVVGIVGGTACFGSILIGEKFGPSGWWWRCLCIGISFLVPVLLVGGPLAAGLYSDYAEGRTMIRDGQVWRTVLGPFLNVAPWAGLAGLIGGCTSLVWIERKWLH